MSEQFVSLLVMFISGIFVAATIDLFQLTIERLSPKNIVRKVNVVLELVIWLLLSVCTFYLLYFVKGGEWRFVDPLAQLFGIYTYELMFQKIFRTVGKIFYLLVLRPIYYIGYFFVQVIRLVIKFFVKIFMPIVSFIRKKR